MTYYPTPALMITEGWTFVLLYSADSSLSHRHIIRTHAHITRISVHVIYTHLVRLLGAPLTIHPSSHQLDIGSPRWFGCLGWTSNHPVERFRTCMAGPGRIPSFGLSDAA